MLEVDDAHPDFIEQIMPTSAEVSMVMDSLQGNWWGTTYGSAHDFGTAIVDMTKADIDSNSTDNRKSDKYWDTIGSLLGVIAYEGWSCTANAVSITKYLQKLVRDSIGDEFMHELIEEYAQEVDVEVIVRDMNSLSAYLPDTFAHQRAYSIDLSKFDRAWQDLRVADKSDFKDEARAFYFELRNLVIKIDFLNAMSNHVMSCYLKGGLKAMPPREVLDSYTFESVPYPLYNQLENLNLLGLENAVVSFSNRVNHLSRAGMWIHGRYGMMWEGIQHTFNVPWVTFQILDHVANDEIDKFNLYEEEEGLTDD